MREPFLPARWLWTTVGLLLALLCTSARADTPISLLRSFAGNYNFTGTEATIRNSGTNVCTVIKKNTTVSKTLSTVPAGATVQAAYLYWAGSGAAADFSVTFENRSVTAQRQYTGSFVNGATNYYFSGVADVTSIVKAKSSTGNGTYTFGGLTVDNSTNYCNVQGVVGGFALMVVYTLPSEPFRVLNMYEGFQSIRNSTVTLNLSNFRIPNPIGSATARIGHITWEGDQNLNLQGENLTFNGVTLSDVNNPSGNQFNSSSNIDGDTASYGIDFDAYTIASPTIKADDTTAVATYASGQDLVWLNVEMVAVPNVPTADLGMTMLRTGDPAPGGSVTYTLTVTNNGPNNDPGPITVVNTLPAGMTYGAVSGTGWSCTTSGITATCTSTATSSTNPLAAGQSLPVLTISALVGQSSTATTYTNSAKVTGSRFDNVSANNTATDTWTDTTSMAAGYVFTDAACVVGTVIGTPASGCNRFTGPYIANSTISPKIYITTVDAGLTVALKKSGASPTVNLRFALVCINPVKDNGVAAQYAGQSMTCNPAATTLANYVWSPLVNVTFASGTSSGTLTTTGAVPTFSYKDVGMVQLYLLDPSSSVTASTRFVSAPESVSFASITNAAINGGASGTNSKGANGFAKVGEAFNASVKVAMANNGGFPPNFGNEAGPYGKVGVILGAPDTSLVTGAVGAVSGGVYPLTIKYAAVGNVNLTASIGGSDGNNSYSSGTYFGVPVTTDTQTVGYFYPDHFETTPQPALVCAASMNCPVGTPGDSITVSGAAYSLQPFTVNVAAFSADATPVDLTSQLSVLPTASISVTPVDKPGPTGAALSYTGATLSSNTAGFPPATVSPKLAVMYDAALGAASWTPPVTMYWRATMNVARASGSATITDTVSSSRVAGSKEGGVRIINGRMLISNGVGSELLKMPVHLQSQYWTGSIWENLISDDVTLVPNSNANTAFTNCQKNLATGAAAPGNCKNALQLQGGSPITLKSGQGTVTMLAPGAGNTGSAMVQITGTQPWLPSTIGQIAFGIYKSSVIYIREVY